MTGHSGDARASQQFLDVDAEGDDGLNVDGQTEDEWLDLMWFNLGEGNVYVDGYGWLEAEAAIAEVGIEEVEQFRAELRAQLDRHELALKAGRGVINGDAQWAWGGVAGGLAASRHAAVDGATHGSTPQEAAGRLKHMTFWHPDTPTEEIVEHLAEASAPSDDHDPGDPEHGAS
jgi:hypothetical protein